MRIFYKKILFISFLFIQSAYSFGSGYYFYVQLKDKNNSPYSLTNPSVYLSQRAMDRRAFYHVPVDSADMPVNPQYVNQLSGPGIQVHCTTKWLNGVTVLLSDSSKMATVRTLPFVKSVQFTGITNENNPPLTKSNKVPTSEYDYGVATAQLDQLNGRILHQNGFKGENVHIAVLDAGFSQVNNNPAFSTLRNEGRLLGTKDFANPNSNIFLGDSHGAMVLSAMAAELDGSHVGTAPKASYLLIITEAEGEYLCEPDFWVSGIEYADSAGVDLATTSLGYTKFDDPSMNYRYSDLNGKTARASIAATIAFTKGIFLLNSAGNDGNNSWRYISVPADSEGVLTVGSVNKNGIYSSFSSIGPSADGRIKPELCATGSSSALIGTDGNTTYQNGTSFATPIMAGITACYLQAAKTIAPQLSLSEIRNFLYQSGHLYATPTAKLGYGIPDFQEAYYGLIANSVNQINANRLSKNNVFKIVVDGAKRNTLIRLETENHSVRKIARVFSLTGHVVSEKEYSDSFIEINTKSLEKGIYIIQIDTVR